MGREKIVVLGTGGTIAGTAASAHDSARYVAAQRGVDELLQGLPRDGLPALEVVSEQVAQLDSKDMTPTVWRRLLARCRHWLAQPGVAGLVITHGTDTIEETAFFLHQTLSAPVPVVFTCAMRPATSVQADGPQNLLDALALAAHPRAHGVMLVCAGVVHDARAVQKVRTWQLDPFSSGDAGPLGHVVHGQVRQLRAWPRAERLWSIPEDGELAWPRVEIVLSHAGATAAQVDVLASAACAQRLGVPPVRGLVVAGTGGGTVHAELEAALLRAQATGVRVWRSTRCALGQINEHAEQALPGVAGLSPVKARIALMLELLAADAANSHETA